MRKKVILAAILGAAVSVTLAGCKKEEQEIDGSLTIASAGDEKMSYAAASVYKRIMQAETYDYLQSYATSSDVWSEEALGGDGVTYGEQFDEEIRESVEEMLLASLHADEYGIVFTAEDGDACTKVAKYFLKNTDEEALLAMYADEDAVMSALEYLTVASKVKAKIVRSADVEVTDEEARQVGFAYAVVLPDSCDDPESVAATILEAAESGDDLETAAEKEGQPYISTSYTAKSPEYDDFPDGMIETLEGMDEGEYVQYSGEDNSIFILYRRADNDEEATATKKETLLSAAIDAAYEETLDGWKKEDIVTFNEDAWKTLEANGKSIYKPVEMYEDKSSLLAGSTGSEEEASIGETVTSKDDGAVSVTIGAEEKSAGNEEESGAESE